MRLLAHSKQARLIAGQAWSRCSAFAAAAGKPLPWLTAAALAIFATAGDGQQQWHRQGDSWVRVYSGTLPASARLRIAGHGPVTVTGGPGRQITYTVTVSVMSSSAARAQMVVNQHPINVETGGEWALLSTPGGAALSTVVVRAPRLSALAIATTTGAVDAQGINGSIDIKTGADRVSCDRIRGDATLQTGGGDIRVGEVDGSLRCGTRGGRISVKTVRGQAVLATDGGDIEALQAGGPVNAQTGAGTVHIGSANGPVDAATGGGEIIVDKATGLVTARNLAGPVQVGAAAGVSCESHSGGIRVNNITGAMRVSTSAGSIFASLLNPARLTDSLLTTGNGDITVVIPSNVGVNIRAVNAMTDNMRRIVSDFRQLQARLRGAALVAEGSVNGGGPLLEINGRGGTIFIKRQ